MPQVIHRRVVRMKIERQHSGLKCCPGGNMYFNNRCMNLTRFVRSTCSILFLCPLSLSSCGTSSTPPKGNTPGASSCGTAGKTHTIDKTLYSSTPSCSKRIHASTCAGRRKGVTSSSNFFCYQNMHASKPTHSEKTH